MTTTTIMSSVGAITLTRVDEIVERANAVHSPNFRKPRSELRQIIDTLGPGEGVVLTQAMLAIMLPPTKTLTATRLRGITSTRAAELERKGERATFTVRSLGDGAYGVGRTS